MLFLPSRMKIKAKIRSSLIWKLNNVARKIKSNLIFLQVSALSLHFPEFRQKSVKIAAKNDRFKSDLLKAKIWKFA